MAGKKGMVRPSKETVSMLNRIDKHVYEKLLRLKIVEGANISFNKYVNRILAGYVNENGVKIEGREIDYSEFE